MCACVHACMRACVHVHVHRLVCGRATDGSNSGPSVGKVTRDQAAGAAHLQRILGGGGLGGGVGVGAKRVAGSGVGVGAVCDRLVGGGGLGEMGTVGLAAGCLGLAAGRVSLVTLAGPCPQGGMDAPWLAMPLVWVGCYWVPWPCGGPARCESACRLSHLSFNVSQKYMKP